MPATVVDCNECGKKFPFVPITRSFKDVDIVYIQCNHCEARYFSYVQDSQIKYRMRKAKKMIERYNDEDLDMRKRQKILEKKKEYDKETNRLMTKKQTEYKDLIQKVINPEEG